MYTLVRRQWLAAPAEEVWAFLQNPANLDRITPPDLRFRIVTEVPAIMHDGLIIEYRIAIPLLGTHAWITEIKHVRPGRSFVDEQRLGPYRFWHHYHEIEPECGGVRMLDRVCYLPPFGPLGRLLHLLYIRKILERIFDYRSRQLQRLFTGDRQLSAKSADRPAPSSHHPQSTVP